MHLLKCEQSSMNIYKQLVRLKWEQSGINIYKPLTTNKQCLINNNKYLTMHLLTIRHFTSNIARIHCYTSWFTNYLTSEGLFGETTIKCERMMAYKNNVLTKEALTLFVFPIEPTMY